LDHSVSASDDRERGHSERLVEVAVDVQRVIPVRTRGCILVSSLEKGYEYGFRVFKVIMNDVDEIGVVHDVHDELP